MAEGAGASARSKPSAAAAERGRQPAAIVAPPLALALPPPAVVAPVVAPPPIGVEPLDFLAGAFRSAPGTGAVTGPAALMEFGDPPGERFSICVNSDGDVISAALVWLLDGCSCIEAID